MGSPEIAVPSLQALIEGGESIIGIVSQPDRPAGRGQGIASPPVAQRAREKKIPLFQPASVKNNQLIKTLNDLRPDLIVVVAYGKILPKEILDLPPMKCINVHFSLLPRYRGAAPVQWSLINGDEETGVTTLIINEQLDAGPILLQKKTPIEPEDNVERLSHRLANLGATLLTETISLLKANDLYPTPQNDQEATPAPSLKKEDGRLDFTQKAKGLVNQIRGMTPWPGATTSLNGQRLKIFWAEELPRKPQGQPGEVVAVGPLGIEVACTGSSLLIKEVQREGKKRMPAGEFLKGHSLTPGTILV